MWLLAVSASLISAVLLLYKRYRLKVVSLCRRAQAWTLWLLRKKVCAQSTHAFVFSQCTHGKVDSVLKTYDLYHSMFPSLSIGAQIGAQLDAVVRRVQPSMALELGMHCGYSSVRILRLLPSGGRLITVEKDPQTADYGEELILVAGFKHQQFEVLALSSSDGIPLLLGCVSSHEEGFSLVLMDHDPGQYLTDLKSLECAGLLRSGGCSIVLIYRDRGAGRDIREYVQTREHCYCIQTDTRFMVECTQVSHASLRFITNCRAMKHYWDYWECDGLLCPLGGKDIELRKKAFVQTKLKA